MIENRTLKAVCALALLLALNGGLGLAQGPVPQGVPLGTAFTYQGRLNRDGAPFTGACNLRFGVYDAVSNGVQIGSTLTRTGVSVNDGLFTVADLDFGSGVFAGEARWLEISVQCASDTVYVRLSPRQALAAAPYALALPGLWTQPHIYSPNLIGGWSGNGVSSYVYGAAIGGGGKSNAPNRVTDNFGTVGGGYGNRAGNDAGSLLDAECATVGGGDYNIASNLYATVGGGNGNDASGSYATIGGGNGNDASGSYATVGGGDGNDASGSYATVGGGRSNIAAGDYSFAAGRGAQANNPGCFVWGDASTSLINCNVDNRWMARAAGGVYFYTNSSLTTGVYVSAGGGSWSTVSDRNLKENVAAVDGREVLAILETIPISTWNYRTQDASIRHIGPMAQDFYAAFGLGENDISITTVDLDGVALAAIQGLHSLSQEQAGRIEQLETENALLHQRLDGLDARL